MRGFAKPLAVALATLLTACPMEDRSCTPEGKKETVLELARSWYLFPDLLDPNIDPAAYPDAESMLHALVAPAVAAKQDRGWSFLTTIDASRTLYQAGQNAGYGIGVLLRKDVQGVDHLRVSQVFPGSAADDAGFRRGDDILKIGADEATLVPMSEILASSGGWRAAFGPPSTEGVTRVFELQKLDGTILIRTVTTRIYDLSPVQYRIEGDVGIVVLRIFVSTADDQLSAAMGAFKLAGVKSVVVDVRYNGGGLVATAKLLANLLSADLAGATMYTLRNNADHTLYDEAATFAPSANAIQPLRVAFITTDATASASELVPNMLEPYLTGGATPDIALVGATTYGKPVGQRGWTISSCGDVLYLVSFRILNSEGEGGYYSGLPDVALPPASPAFAGPLCPAEDDLTQEQGTPLEASTAAALYWIANGTCPPQPATALSNALVSPPQPDSYPAPSRPSPAQIEIPGLF